MKKKLHLVSFLFLLFFTILNVKAQNKMAFDIENNKINIGKNENGKKIKLEHNIVNDLSIKLSYPENDNPNYNLRYSINNSPKKTKKLNKKSPNYSTIIISKTELKEGNIILEFLNDNNLVPNAMTIKLNGLPKTAKQTQKTNTDGETSPETATGNIMEDAFLLKKYKNGSNLKLVLDILSTHTNKELVGNQAELLEEFKENDYLTAYIESVNWNYQDSIAVEESRSSLLGTVSNVTSSVRGLYVTNIADGFAKFIVKRTKEELSIAFFEKFKKELDENPNIQSVFPQTYKSLSAIDKEIYMFKAYIQTLREAFEEDLSNLPDNLPTIIDNNLDFFNTHLELKATLLSSFYLAGQIKDGVHPGIMIEEFPDDNWAEVSNKNYQAAFKTIKLFSTSFRDSKGGDAYWLPYSEIKKLFQDEDLLKLYLGLLVEQAKLENIVFEKESETTVIKEDLYKIINNASEIPNDINSYKTFIKEIVQKTQTIELKVKELPTIENDSLRFEKYYSIITNSLDLMRKTVRVEKLPHIQELKLELEIKTKPYFDMAQTTADVAIGVNRRNYASAIVSVLDLFNKAFEIYGEKDSVLVKLQADVESNRKIVYDLNNRNDKKEKKELKNAEDELEEAKTKLNEYFEKHYKNKYAAFFKYGTFMATVAQAKNSEQIEEAIEAFALPTGSARIKRESPFNVALNAYCGLFYGGENIKGLDNGYKSTYGITAPVGISVNMGKNHILPFCEGGHWSHSIFLSIIDIGAVTAFRFKDDTTKSVPTIELGDIISPGLFYSIGIPKSPLSINLGYQIGPLLRKVTATDNTYQNSYSRLSIAFVVDIPILNFYTKSK